MERKEQELQEMKRKLHEATAPTTTYQELLLKNRYVVIPDVLTEEETQQCTDRLRPLFRSSVKGKPYHVENLFNANVNAGSKIAERQQVLFSKGFARLPKPIEVSVCIICAPYMHISNHTTRLYVCAICMCNIVFLRICKPS